MSTLFRSRYSARDIGENDQSASSLNVGHNLYFFELMTSPGPRKDPATYGSAIARELGEDAAGLINLPGYTLFWLSDGTSDESVLHGFSARILAQDAGLYLCEAAEESASSGNPLDLLNLLNKGLNKIFVHWQERMDMRWKTLQDGGETKSFQKMFVPCGDGSLQISWSTTFLAGLLCHETGNLEIANLGDAGCLVQNLAGESMPTAIGYDRLFVKMLTEPDADRSPKVYINPNNILPERIQVFKNVDALLCLTDGNSVVPLRKLFEQHSQRGVAGLAALIKQSRGLSYDDRTLLLGMRLRGPIAPTPIQSTAQDLIQPYEDPDPAR